MRHEFGGLLFGGAYTWMGLFSEFYGILLSLQIARFLRTGTLVKMKILYFKRPVNVYKFPRNFRRKQYLQNVFFREFNVSDY